MQSRLPFDKEDIMKKTWIGKGISLALAACLLFAGCGTKEEALPATAPEESSAAAPEEIQATAPEEIPTDAPKGEGAEEPGYVGMANPWKDCTEEEAKAACPRLFKAPEGAKVLDWMIMDEGSNLEAGKGPLVQLEFELDGRIYCARAQYGAAEDADISGLYYDWDAEDDATLANWGEGHMQGKCYRDINESGMLDLITWYDIEIGIAYALSMGDTDLDGFDIQAIAEQMYDPANEPYTGE